MDHAAFVAVEGGTVDEDVVDGSTTIFVDATTGRVTRIDRVIGVRESGGGTRRERTTYRFSRYGETDVSPPDALDRPTLEELLHDVLVY